MVANTGDRLDWFTITYEIHVLAIVVASIHVLAIDVVANGGDRLDWFTITYEMSVQVDSCRLTYKCVIVRSPEKQHTN